MRESCVKHVTGNVLGTSPSGQCKDPQPFIRLYWEPLGTRQEELIIQTSGSVQVSSKQARAHWCPLLHGSHKANRSSYTITGERADGRMIGAAKKNYEGRTKNKGTIAAGWTKFYSENKFTCKLEQNRGRKRAGTSEKLNFPRREP